MNNCNHLEKYFTNDLLICILSYDHTILFKNLNFSYKIKKIFLTQYTEYHESKNFNDISELISECIIDKKNFNYIKYFISKGANINHQDINGNTALMIAAGKGYENRLKFLIKNGANVNIQNNQGDTALMIAAFNGNLFCLITLIDFNADISIRNGLGRPMNIWLR